MDKELTHRHLEHLAYALVMPVAQARDGRSREATQLATIQQHYKDTAG